MTVRGDRRREADERLALVVAGLPGLRLADPLAIGTITQRRLSGSIRPVYSGQGGGGALRYLRHAHLPLAALALCVADSSGRGGTSPAVCTRP